MRTDTALRRTQHRILHDYPEVRDYLKVMVDQTRRAEVRRAGGMKHLNARYGHIMRDLHMMLDELV